MSCCSGGTGSLSHYLRVDKHVASIDPDLKRTIVFAQHNLVSDGSFNEFHLLFAPGGAVQFNKELQSRAHGVLYNSMIRLGFLALGRDESVATSPHAQAFRKLETEALIYRRIK